MTHNIQLKISEIPASILYIMPKRYYVLIYRWFEILLFLCSPVRLQRGILILKIDPNRLYSFLLLVIMSLAL